MYLRPVLDLLRRLRVRLAPVARVRTGRLSLVERLECRSLLSGDSLLPVTFDAASAVSGSDPADFTNVNGTLFFTASSPDGGRELWKSDGTSAGTVQVKDIVAGPGSSAPRYLTNVGGTLYFSADNGADGRELWKSDGTSAGTVQITNVTTGLGSLFPRNLTDVNGTLFFAGTNGVDGVELWKSDGTSAGTVQVQDVFDGPASSSPTNLVNVAGTLYFVAEDGTADRELWKSDGTDGGTSRVKDIYVGPIGSSPINLTNVNGTLFFNATDFIHVDDLDQVRGRELWRSDGTSDGTVQVADIRAGQSSSFPAYLTNVNGTLYFRANDGFTGDELWRSDGTAAGTMLVADIRPGSRGSYLGPLTNVNGTLFFTAEDADRDRKLWKSDGTSAGTVVVRAVDANSLTAINGILYFTADDGFGRLTLWKSDGTDAGTMPVQDVNSAEYALDPESLIDINGTLYFSATNGIGGRELWVSDGTAAGTRQVLDFGDNQPHITNVPDQTIQEDGTTAPLPFTISDADTDIGNLTVTVTSSNAALISQASITIGGSGAHRTLVLSPLPEQSGSAVITITVSDGVSSTNESFQVTVETVDDLPVITTSAQPLTVSSPRRKAVSIDDSATITDVDAATSKYNGWVLNVSGQSTADKLSILNGPNIRRHGSKLLVNGLNIGSVSGGKHGAALKIRFNDKATQAAVQVVLRGIGFTTNDKQGNRTIWFELVASNGGGATGTMRDLVITP